MMSEMIACQCETCGIQYHQFPGDKCTQCCDCRPRIAYIRWDRDVVFYHCSVEGPGYTVLDDSPEKTIVLFEVINVNYTSFVRATWTLKHQPYMMIRQADGQDQVEALAKKMLEEIMLIVPRVRRYQPFKTAQEMGTETGSNEP